MIRQHRMTKGGDKDWDVDVDALCATNVPWLMNTHQTLAARNRTALELDLREMHDKFRHWILVGGSHDRPHACGAHEIAQFIVPREGAMRCLECGCVFRDSVTSLQWIGNIPVPITGSRAVERIVSDGRSVLSVVQGHMLVPVRIVYPGRWPAEAPLAYYYPEFFQSIGIRMPSTSHAHHMMSGGQLCMFSRWRSMSIRDVIVNRIIPHAVALMIIADGRRPERWFND